MQDRELIEWLLELDAEDDTVVWVMEEEHGQM
jgi:hypothetical protein